MLFPDGTNDCIELDDIDEIEVIDIFIKKRPIFDEMLQAVLLLKKYYLSAYENCQDDINGSKLNLKD